MTKELEEEIKNLIRFLNFSGSIEEFSKLVSFNIIDYHLKSNKDTNEDFYNMIRKYFEYQENKKNKQIEEIKRKIDLEEQISRLYKNRLKNIE